MNAPMPRSHSEAAIHRLQSLSPAAEANTEALAQAARSLRRVNRGREILAEGDAIGGPMIVLSGWAHRTHVLQDGRRQILGFLLPGDVFGLCRQQLPLAQASVVALTPVELCAAPPASPGSALEESYAISAALEDAYQLRHITRLGRMTAYERVADWLLDLWQRLNLVGLVEGKSFPLPVTQEIIADVLGLTSVHVNRTLQALRRDGMLDFRNGNATLLDINRLVALVGWRPAKVSAAVPPSGAVSPLSGGARAGAPFVA